jgi:hypothetical protein
MFAFNRNIPSPLYTREFMIMVPVAALFSFFTLIPGGLSIQDKVYGSFHRMRAHLVLTCLAVLLLILSLSSITSADFNPFIYFRF